MDTRDIYKLVRELSEERDDVVNLYDSMDIELSEDFVIETGVVGFTEDGVIVHLDEDAIEMLDLNGILLESDQYEDIQEDDGGQDMPVDHFLELYNESDDAFEVIYDAIKGEYGEEVRRAMQALYDDIVIDSQGSLHPDDDFEDIIGFMIDHLEDEVGTKHDDDLYEIAALKKLALGEAHTKECPHCHGDGGHDKLTVKGGYHTVPCNKCSGTGRVESDDEEEVAEGLGKALLGGAALIAAITGINKYQADQLMKNEPQLVKLAQMRQAAEKQGDSYKVQELDDRIEKTLDHIRVTGRPVMGPDGNPVVPGEPLGEAEYQGRKVQLNKPMQGDVKKSKVYVKKPNGKVVKVNFGDKDMKIKKNNPERRKSFRARHNCDNPGPKWKARYWSCRAW